jgi:hypothetical protein
LGDFGVPAKKQKDNPNIKVQNIYVEASNFEAYLQKLRDANFASGIVPPSLTLLKDMATSFCS